jgi:hypothetical protein
MKLSGKKLQVEHYFNPPCNPFVVPVKDEHEARKTENLLADQMNFLYTENQIHDFVNVIVVTMFNEETLEWEDYYNEHEGMDWDEFKELLEESQSPAKP